MQKSFDKSQFLIQAICENLPFTRPDPIRPDEYAEHLSGNWDDVPAWAIRRINFLEEQMQRNDKRLCPEWENTCPDCQEYSCHIVKHCYPYLCSGSCGHNEIWVCDKGKKLLKDAGLI